MGSDEVGPTGSGCGCIRSSPLFPVFLRLQLHLSGAGEEVRGGEGGRGGGGEGRQEEAAERGGTRSEHLSLLFRCFHSRSMEKKRERERSFKVSRFLPSNLKGCFFVGHSDIIGVI